MKKSVLIVALVAALAAVGCKKKKTEDTGTASGSATMDGSGSAATMAGSGSSMTMAGSGSADGSAAMVGSGSAAMAGSGSAAMAGSGGPPRPASVTDAMVATADKAVDQMVKLGTALQATGGDCKKATAAITAAAPGISAAIEEMEKMKPEADPAAKEWFKYNYSTKADVMGDAMGQIIPKCQGDKDFMDAMKKLGMMKKKDTAPAPGQPPAPPQTK